MNTLRLGTRGSMLARAQSQLVASALEALHPGLRVELEIIQTSGDAVTDRPLHELGGKGLFTREIEQALLRGQIDCAVHSYKDVPVTLPLVDVSRLTVAATPEREDPADVLVCRVADSIGSLPAGARVGTGSLRRRAQLLRRRPDLNILPIRGNIDTRLRKLAEGSYDAVILAMAGLKRAGLLDRSIMHPIDRAELLPAAGQGALALQCRKADLRTVELLSAYNHEPTAQSVAAERRIVELLQGDCQSPIAAFAELKDGIISLWVSVGAMGGHPPCLDAAVQGETAESAARKAFAELTLQGVQGHWSARR